jgi:hypothetical protein
MKPGRVKFMVIHEQIPQPGLKSHKDKTRGSAPRIALPLRPLREAFIFVSIRGLELLFYTFGISVTEIDEPVMRKLNGCTGDRGNAVNRHHFRLRTELKQSVADRL